MKEKDKKEMVKYIEGKDKIKTERKIDRGK